MIAVMTVEPWSIDTMGYDDAIFIVMDGKIYSECPETGLCERPDMTLEELEAHLLEMSKDGFKVNHHIFECKRGEIYHDD